MKNLNLNRDLFKKREARPGSPGSPVPVIKPHREANPAVKVGSGSFMDSLSDLTTRKTVTLEISGDSIKLLEVRGQEIKRWASAPYKLSNVPQEEVFNTLGIAVKQLLAKSGIKAKEVILSVSGLSTINRILHSTTASVELMNPESLRALVEEEMALTAEQLYLSWKTLHPAGGEWQIYVVGVLREVLDTQIRSLKAAGIDPRIIEFKPVTLCRLVAKKETLILNIEPGSFDIIVVSDSIPVVAHTTAWQANIMDTEERAEQLTLALELAVDFHNTQHPETAVTESITLSITGAFSADTELVNKVRDMSGYQVELVTPRLKYPAGFNPADYATNIGLALREAGQSGNFLTKLNTDLMGKKPSNRQSSDTYESLAINLLPQAYQPWKPSSRQVFAVGILILAAILIIPFYNAVSSTMSYTGAMETRYKLLSSELERRKLDIKNREPLLAQINEYNTITTTAGYLAADLTLIRETADKLGVKLLNVSHGGKLISVGCEAENTILRQYASTLQTSGRFVTVKLPDDFWVFPPPDTVGLELESKLGK